MKIDIDRNTQGDLQAIGDMLLAKVRKVGVGRKATVVACFAALRSALDALSPDERAGAVAELVAELTNRRPA